MRDVLLIIHFIGLAMGLGTSFALMFLGFTASKMEKEEGKKFKLNTFALIRMGHVGLTLLVISGLGMLHPYFDMLKSNWMLITKLILVLVLGALIGIFTSNAKKARKGNADVYQKKITAIGRLSLLVTITIIILAVLIFH